MQSLSVHQRISVLNLNIMQIANFYEFGSITYEEQLMLLRFCRCGFRHNCDLPPPLPHPLQRKPQLSPLSRLPLSRGELHAGISSVFSPWGKIKENSLASIGPVLGKLL